MTIINDNHCTWINQLPSRKNIKILNKNLTCDYLIIGAGFTGLSAARKIAELENKKKIIITDSQMAGEGASGRNSGFLVDTTLNDGFSSNKELNFYKKKTHIYKLGIQTVKKFVKEYQVDCDWNETGKYFASSIINDEKILLQFSKILNKLGFENKILNDKELKNKIGTDFYKTALYTKGGILLNPAKLARSMVNALPTNVELYEQSHLLKWSESKNKIECIFENGKILTNKIIFATNGFLKSLGIKNNYNFPLTLTASMTRPLSDKELKTINNPFEFGILPVRPMGATIRMTKDKRILIRNTAEIHNPFKMKKIILNKRILNHKLGIKKRYPSLPDELIESSWSGIVSRTGNGSQIFEKIRDNIFVAGSYNGSGIGVGTLFGEQIAIKAINETSEEISLIESRKKPNWLPPDPILGLGIKAKLFYERIRAKSEI